MDISQRVLFTASADQTIKKWDIVSGEYRQTLKGHNASVTKIAVKDKLLVSTSADWSVRMWSAQFGDFIKKFEGGHGHMVNCLQWLDGCGKGLTCRRKTQFFPSIFDLFGGKFLLDWKASSKYFQLLYSDSAIIVRCLENLRENRHCDKFITLPAGRLRTSPLLKTSFSYNSRIRFYNLRFRSTGVIRKKCNGLPQGKTSLHD